MVARRMAPVIPRARRISSSMRRTSAAKVVVGSRAARRARAWSRTSVRALFSAMRRASAASAVMRSMAASAV
jgi:hypothetical protein